MLYISLSNNYKNYYHRSFLKIIQSYDLIFILFFFRQYLHCVILNNDLLSNISTRSVCSKAFLFLFFYFDKDFILLCFSEACA